MIDSRHFQELIAYDKLYGVPDPIEEAAVICETVANATAPKKNGAWRREQFMKGTRPKPKQTPEQVEARLRQYARPR